MIKQTKNKTLVRRYLSTIGIGGMALATVVGMVELGSHPTNRYVIPGQTVQLNNQNELNNPVRRENEGSNPIYVSYSESQRTPSRASKH